MEFREFYFGICAKIRFNYATNTYIGELDGLAEALVIEAESYDEIRDHLKQAAREQASGRSESIEGEWKRIAHLERIRAVKKAVEAKERKSGPKLSIAHPGKTSSYPGA